MTDTQEQRQERRRDPAHMEWPVLRKHLWGLLDNEDEQHEDDTLVATRAELLAALSWADKFNRDAQPRRDEEEQTFDLIRQAAAQMEDRTTETAALTAENAALREGLVAERESARELAFIADRRAAALRCARGWLLTCIESPQAKRDLRTLDASLALKPLAKAARALAEQGAQR